MSEVFKQLPYCIKKEGPQKFQLLNRRYKEVGKPFFARIPESLQRRLSFNGKSFEENEGTLWFYNDGLKRNKNWPEEYWSRFGLLLKIKALDRKRVTWRLGLHKV